MNSAIILPRNSSDWDPCLQPLLSPQNPAAFFEMQNSVLNMGEDANGSLIFPHISSQALSPLTCASDHDIPDEFLDDLMNPTYRDLSSIEDVKIISTAFDPARGENIHIKYTASNKKGRFRYTAKQRNLAEAGCICYSMEEFETKVSIFKYMVHHLICHL